MSLLDKIFGGEEKTKKTPEQGLRIVEGITGFWVYHLAHGEKAQALCNPDRGVLETKKPLDTWGLRSELNEIYCQNCETIAREKDLGLSGENPDQSGAGSEKAT